MSVAFFLTLALQAASGDMPIATQAAPPPQAPKPTAASPPPSLLAANPAAAPADDYGYVSWCYGALGTYLALYDQVMPEISRIEHAFPGPEGVEEAMKVYPQLRAQAQGDLKLYASAMRAAEKASASQITLYGQTSIKRGRLVWGGINAVTPAKLAQLWMSWSPPEKCEVTAKALKARSAVLGQAMAVDPNDAGLMAAEALPEPPVIAPIAPPAVVAAPPKVPAKPVAAKPAPPVAVAVAPAPTPAPAPEPKPPMLVAATTPLPSPVAAPPEPDAPMAAALAEAPAAPAPLPKPPEAPPVAPPPAAFVPEPTPTSYDPKVDPALWYRGVP